MKKVIYVFVLIVSVHLPSLGQQSEPIKDFESTYHNDIIGVSKNGIIKGKDAMTAYLKKLLDGEGALLNFKEHFKVSVNQNLDYAIGSFQTEQGSNFTYLAISIKTDDQEKKILEVLYEVSNAEKIPEEINKAREKWMTLCNQHNAKKLVEALYTDNAIYYNRGRLLRGHDQLSQEYSYMNSPSYKLQLTPKHVEMVSEDTAFEIGRCSGSYPLPYMLVWKKQADGNWKIYLDSNY